MCRCAAHIKIMPPAAAYRNFSLFSLHFSLTKKEHPFGVFFLCYFVWKYRMPSVRGPQWLETVQPARVCSTSSKG